MLDMRMFGMCMLYQGNPPIIFYRLVAILFRSAILLAYFARQIYYKLIKQEQLTKFIYTTNI